MAKPVDNSLIKKPNLDFSYSMDQLKEFRACANPTTGPYHFLDNYHTIQHPTRGRIQYTPFIYQKELAEVYHENLRSINLLGRQLGKSTTAAGYLLWFAMFNSDVTVLIAAHKYIGAQEIMQRIRFSYENCPDHIRCGVAEYNKQSIVFENGSRIVAQTTTPTTGRGMSISLLYCDEFAFVRPSIAKEFWGSISPTLSTGGKVIITSTPNSDDDQFSELWKGANKKIDEFGNPTTLGVNGFGSYFADWSVHPERDAAWAALQKASIGDEVFAREHECRFIIADETLINAFKLASLSGIEPIERQGQIRWYKQPDKNCLYFVALDPSLGTGSDPAAIQVFESPSLIQVAEWQHNKTDIRQQVRNVGHITEALFNAGVPENSIYYSIENNNIGEAALMAVEEVGEENIKGSFHTEPKKMGSTRKYRKGFTTTNTSKIAACSKLKSLVENDKITIYSKNLISELKSFIAVGPTFKAKQGDTDDLVLALVLVVRMVQVVKDFHPELYESMKLAAEEESELAWPMPFIVF